MAAEIKMVMLGSGGVGKSATVIQFIQQHFVDEYDPTIEDSYRKQIVVDDVTTLLDILDTAGQEEYSAMRDQYMRGGDVFLIAYAITSRSSFDEVGSFWEQILRIKDVDEFPAVLYANKTDLEDEREVSVAEGKDYAASLGIPFFEGSAKTYADVVEPMFQCVREYWEAGGGNASGKPSKKKKEKKKKKKTKKKKEVPKKEPKVGESHTEAVWCLKVIGDFVYSGSRDRTCRQFEVATGTNTKLFTGHSGIVYDIQVATGEQVPSIKTGGKDLPTPNGVLFTVSADSTMKAFELDTCMCIKTYEGHTGGINCLAVNETWTWLYTGSRDGTLRAWDLQTGESKVMNLADLKAVDNPALLEVNCISYTPVTLRPEGGVLWSGSADNVVRAWDPLSGECLRELKQHSSYVMHMAANEEFLFTASADKCVCAWNLKSLEFFKSYNGGHKDWINAVAVEGTRLFTGCRDTTLKSFDIHSGELLHTFEGHTSTVRTIDVSNGVLCSGGKDKSIRWWDATSGKLLFIKEGHKDWVVRCAYGRLR